MIAVTAAPVLAIATSLTTSASARITQETFDTSCTNNGGHDQVVNNQAVRIRMDSASTYD